MTVKQYVPEKWRAQLGTAARNYMIKDLQMTAQLYKTVDFHIYRGGAPNVRDRDCTVVQVSDSSSGITVTGSAKRRKGDKHDARVGYDLALGRAMRKLADTLESRHKDV